MIVSSPVCTDVIEHRRAGHAAREHLLFPAYRPTRHGSIMRLSGRIRNQYLC
jgi:hypothetical protein